MQATFLYLNRRHPVVFLKLKIRWFYSIETQQQLTNISSPVCLQVSVFSRPFSGKHFRIEGTIVVHYT